ncbi:unnamed protein product [Alternaria alternata]
MAGSRNYDFLIKLLLIGDSGVGKSCCLLRFSEDSFTPSFITTIGIDFKIRTIELDGKRVKLQISGYRRAGAFPDHHHGLLQRRYGPFCWSTTLQMKGASTTFAHGSPTSSNTPPRVSTRFLLATSAIGKKRAVSTEQGQALADELGIPFLEVSAKSNINVDQAFYSLAGDIKKRLIDTARTDQTAVPKVDVGGQDSGNAGMGGKCC